MATTIGTSTTGVQRPPKRTTRGVRRVFLFGCSRSGTTVLQSRLSAHPDIVSFPETQFFSGICGRLMNRRFGRRRRGIAGSLAETAADARLAARLSAPNVDALVRRSLKKIRREDELGRFPLRSRRIKPIATPFVELFDEVAAEEGAAAWLEKSPDHVFYADVIAECAPDARFIHNIRRGQDNIASLWDAANRYPGSHWEAMYRSIDDCIAHWVGAIRATLRHARSPNHLVVVHREFLAEPDQTLSHVFEHIGLDSAVVDDAAVPTDTILNEHGKWNTEVSKELRRTPSSKFEKVFTPDERRYVQDALEAEGLRDWPLELGDGYKVA